MMIHYYLRNLLHCSINFLLLVLLQFISRYCFPLISHTVVAIITLSTTSHSCILQAVCLQAEILFIHSQINHFKMATKRSS